VAIIARDLPVFREIVGEHAFYFSGTGAREFEEALRRWLALYRRGEHIRSDGLHWLTWKESAEQLLGVALWGKWYKHWKPTFSVLEGPSQLPILPQDAQPPGTRINRKSVYPDP